MNDMFITIFNKKIDKSLRKQDCKQYDVADYTKTTPVKTETWSNFAVYNVSVLSL